MKRFLTQTILIIAMVLLSLTSYANEITSIHEIKTDSINFDGKQVNLQGVVKDPTRIPLIALKAYVLEDDSGEITILTDDDLPLMGKEITIRVRVESLAIIKGEALGLTVVELERYEYH